MIDEHALRKLAQTTQKGLLVIDVRHVSGRQLCGVAVCLTDDTELFEARMNNALNSAATLLARAGTDGRDL